MKRLKATTRGRETLARGTTSFPCAGYYTNIEDHITGSIPWHWHEEIEVFLVIGGSCKMIFGSEHHALILKENDGGFINSDILHTLEIESNAGCQLISFVFDSSMLANNEKSRIFQQYIKPLIQCRSIEALPFYSKNDDEHKLLEQFQESFISYVEKQYAHEIKIQNALYSIWSHIVTKNQSLINSPTQNISKEENRAKLMIDFIQKHYDQPITAKEIADSISVSQRECFRCFQNILGDSPISYLTKYRIQVALELLSDTNQNITDIALSTGFNSASYFTKIFKEKMNYTPREYRSFLKTKS